MLKIAEFRTPTPQDVRKKGSKIRFTIVLHTVLVGPCHHGMALPQVAGRGTASDMEVSCE